MNKKKRASQPIDRSPRNDTYAPLLPVTNSLPRSRCRHPKHRFPPPPPPPPFATSSLPPLRGPPNPHPSFSVELPSSLSRPPILLVRCPGPKTHTHTHTHKKTQEEVSVRQGDEQLCMCSASVCTGVYACVCAGTCVWHVCTRRYVEFCTSSCDCKKKKKSTSDVCS